MQIMNYIQPEVIFHIPNNYISEESDFMQFGKNREAISFGQIQFF